MVFIKSVNNQPRPITKLGLNLSCPPLTLSEKLTSLGQVMKSQLQPIPVGKFHTGLLHPYLKELLSHVLVLLYGKRDFIQLHRVSDSASANAASCRLILTEPALRLNLVVPQIMSLSIYLVEVSTTFQFQD
jgi:hypothetical protein